MANAYGDLSYIYAGRTDAENTLSCLRSEAEYRKIFDTYDEAASNTSPAVKGYVDGGWLRADGTNSVQWLIDKMEKDEAFEFLRENGEFKAILEDLKN